MIGYIYILISIFAWSFEYFLIKSASSAISPFLAGITIFSVAGSLLICSSFLGGGISVKNLKRHWQMLVIIGVTGTLCNILWIEGTRLTTVANAAILAKTDIFFSLILSVALFHESVKKSSVVFVPVLLTGVFMVMNIDITKLSVGGIGDIMIIGSAFTLSLNAFFIKHLCDSLPGSVIASVNCIINCIIFGTILVLGNFGNLKNNILCPDMRSFILLALCGVCSFLFFIGYYQSLKRFPVWEVRLLTLFVPVLSAVLGMIFLSEKFTVVKGIGGAIVLLGAAGIIMSNKRPESAAIKKNRGVHSEAKICL